MTVNFGTDLIIYHWSWNLNSDRPFGLPIKFFFVFVPSLQIVLSLIILPAVHQKEVFPIFNWSLFSSTQKIKIMWDLQVEGILLSSKLANFEDARELSELVGKTQAGTQAEKSLAAEDLQQYLKKKFSGQNFKYQVVSKKIELLEYFKTAKFETSLSPEIYELSP